MIKINGKRIFQFIILGVVILNLSWFLITTVKYHKFIKAVPKDKYGVYGIKKEDGFTYSVKKPDYLQYTGNLAVSNMEKGELLIIWPLIFGGYEYGFRVQEEGGAYEIYVDENMNSIDKEDKIAIKKLQEHKAELEELFFKANEMWKLE
ncbi:hypothetical protein SH2C18_44780 [Clostridium sediminicola]|uniref:hypothetical protein n=1 Tax=Clostridium sediminicola TaxID=3114879 RepID=UPI0031F26F4C